MCLALRSSIIAQLYACSYALFMTLHLTCSTLITFNSPSTSTKMSIYAVSRPTRKLFIIQRFHWHWQYLFVFIVLSVGKTSTMLVKIANVARLQPRLNFIASPDPYSCLWLSLEWKGKHTCTLTLIHTQATIKLATSITTLSEASGRPCRIVGS